MLCKMVMLCFSASTTNNDIYFYDSILMCYFINQKINLLIKNKEKYGKI